MQSDEQQQCSQLIAFKDLSVGELFEVKGIAFIKVSDLEARLQFNAIRTDTGSPWHVGATVAVDPMSTDGLK